MNASLGVGRGGMFEGITKGNQWLLGGFTTSSLAFHATHSISTGSVRVVAFSDSSIKENSCCRLPFEPRTLGLWGRAQVFPGTRGFP